MIDCVFVELGLFDTVSDGVIDAVIVREANEDSEGCADFSILEAIEEGEAVGVNIEISEGEEDRDGFVDALSDNDGELVTLDDMVEEMVAVEESEGN